MFLRKLKLLWKIEDGEYGSLWSYELLGSRVIFFYRFVIGRFLRYRLYMSL